MSTLLLLVSSLSFAGSIEYWSDDDYGNGSSAIGTDGWENGYSGDYWYGYDVDLGGGTVNMVFSTSDENGGSFGTGSAADNWLVSSNINVLDGYIVTTAWTLDDDTLGLVFNMVDEDNFYLFALVGGAGESGDGTGSASNPFGMTTVQMALIRVKSGSATVLESTSAMYPYYSTFKLAAGYNDGTLWGKVWENPDAAWADTDVAITATDSNAFSGSGGFYAYDQGGINRGDTYMGFGAISAFAYDEDDDGVIDDEDNCEEVANPDQADADGNGIGTACDPDEAGAGDAGAGGGDAGGGTGTGTDTGTPGGDAGGSGGGTDTSSTGGDTGGADGAGDVGSGGDSTGDVGSDPLNGQPGGKAGEFSACSCNGTGSAAGSVFFALAAALRRRRRAPTAKA